MPVHKIVHPGDQAQNTCFFCRASKAFEFDTGYLCDKFFKKGELDDFSAAVRQINGSFDPVFYILVEAITQLLEVVADQKRSVVQDDDIVKIHPEKIGGIRVYPETFRNTVRLKPASSHLSEMILRKRSSHAAFIKCWGFRNRLLIVVVGGIDMMCVFWILKILSSYLYVNGPACLTL
jgi:hypothetical protein